MTRGLAACEAAATVGFALRQSLHSVAGSEPNEDPLNVFPQLGQMGMVVAG